jgi:hypothetical protein
MLPWPAAIVRIAPSSGPTQGDQPAPKDTPTRNDDDSDPGVPAMSARRVCWRSGTEIQPSWCRPSTTSRTPPIRTIQKRFCEMKSREPARGPGAPSAAPKAMKMSENPAT